MSLLGSIGDAISGVKNDLSNAVSNYVDITTSPISTIAFPLQNPYVQAAGGAAGLALIAGGGIGGAAGAAGAAGSAVSGGSTAAASTSIAASISGFVAEVAAALKNFLDPIKSVIDSTTGIVNQINDSIITPIHNIVTATHDDVHALVTAFHDDLKGGLQGLVHLSSDVTSALTSLDATYQRSSEQLASYQSDIITKNLVPGLSQGIGGPIGDIHALFTESQSNEHLQAAFEATVKLNESVTNDDIIKAALAFEQGMATDKGFFAPIIRAVWGLLKVGDVVIAQVQQQIEEVRQQAKSSLPVTLLSPSETLEALRRNIISSEDAYIEFSKHGIDATRQNVLYDLAQFLFSQTDAVKLLYRKIIDGETYTAIQDQNNLNPDQIAALEQLMLHILGPGDIAAAYARGYVSQDVYIDLFNAALVSPDTMELIQSLELDLLDPRKMAHARGRVQANEKGWLGGYLNQKAPEDIAKQYDRNQAEGGTADLEWLMHWHLPSAGFWVDAYFRGQVTRTEVERAFTALNIPEPLWDIIFKVEEELPPVWMIPDVVASGAWGEAQAIPNLMKLGFSEENAKVLYDYGYSKGKTAKAATAANLQAISIGNAATMYNDGLIDAATYTEILQDHGFSVDAANLTVELDQFKQATQERNQAAQDLVNAVNLGLMDEVQLQSTLYGYGFTDAEVNKWLLKVKQAKAAKAKLPSEAHLDKLLKAGLITPDQWLATMQAIGYSLEWAQLLIQIV